MTEAPPGVRVNEPEVNVRGLAKHRHNRPWSAVLPFTRADGPLYEYACHERNYGMENLLRSARIVDLAAESRDTK